MMAAAQIGVLAAVALVALVFVWFTWRPWWLAILPWIWEAALWIPVLIFAGLFHLLVGGYYLLRRVYRVIDEGISEMLRKKP